LQRFGANAPTLNRNVEIITANSIFRKIALPAKLTALMKKDLTKKKKQIRRKEVTN
jgi:hypothetical protein